MFQGERLRGHLFKCESLRVGLGGQRRMERKEGRKLEFLLSFRVLGYQLKERSGKFLSVGSSRRGESRLLCGQGW